MKIESAIPSETSTPAFRMVGRYVMYDEIAAGGMASVHFGRLVGAVGFGHCDQDVGKVTEAHNVIPAVRRQLAITVIPKS